MTNISAEIEYIDRSFRYRLKSKRNNKQFFRVVKSEG